VLVRTWNLFHGNTLPPTRKAYLREMVELVTADRPDVVCLQEVPGWALGLVGIWAGMQAVTAQTMPPRIGPIQVSAALGRALTSLNHGLLRSAFAGQGNAILLPLTASIAETRAVTLNTPAFCEALGSELGLAAREIRRWRAERRVCQVVRAVVSGESIVAANVHTSSSPTDPRLPDVELRVVVDLVDQAAAPGQLVVLGGDFNIKRESSETLAGLGESWFDVGPGIDHVLVRGVDEASGRVWPPKEREFGGRLLSDHAPVEVSLER
jgi:endonuclease/exonuclease/phosphatase family metal-dependent hydrolase